jgi:ElaB/YqjD/DUF883 family membrane-anchored ribosome-binding protein
VQRRKNSVVAGVQSVRDRVMGTAHNAQHSVGSKVSNATDSVKDVPGSVRSQTQGTPMVAGAIAFGIGFLVAAAFPASKSEQGAAAQLLDRLEPVKEEFTTTVQEVADHLKQPALDAAQAVKDTASDAAGHVSEAAKDAVDDTKQQATDSVSAVKDSSASAADS